MMRAIAVVVMSGVVLCASAFEGWQRPMAYVLAASGGALLYVVAGSMVPRVEHVARERRGPILGAFLFGVLATVAFGWLDACHHAHA